MSLAARDMTKDLRVLMLLFHFTPKEDRFKFVLDWLIKEIKIRTDAIDRMYPELSINPDNPEKS